MQRGQDTSATWTQELNQDNLIPNVSSDYLDSFVELGDDFDAFESVNQHNVNSGLDTPMSRLAFGQEGQIHAQALEMQRQGMLRDIDMNIANIAHMGFSQIPPDGQMQNFQHYPVYQQTPQHYYRQIPPTPISTEMQAAQYKQATDNTGQIIFERQNASFTPLVSPAQTPIENAWNMPDYVMTDEFFSPLTSPAIEAQHQQFGKATTTSSPLDLNTNATFGDQSSNARKSRRKLNPTSRASAPRSVRQSPVTKPVNRRQKTSERTAGNVVPVLKNQLHPGSTSTNLSSEDSVSPEPLLETLMRPPPVPSSKTSTASFRSPIHEGNAPATPATLMKVPGKQFAVGSDGKSTISSPEAMEDISLPAAAADGQSKILPAIDTRLDRDQDEATPVLSAKTPKLSADSTPRSATLKAANGSTENLLKTFRGGRANKKRQSISSAAMSPALRPKISPSISPLVPATPNGVPILSAESSTLYLASKSNYQNILDGTHLPGVSYPENLAENLNSKRTSHKLAEQGRRNRINLALKEVESLLPASILNASRKEKGNGKDDNADMSDAKTANGVGTSKANTVEMAIVYIRSLQAELEVTKSKLEAAEKIIADGNSSGSQASEQASV